MTEERREEVVVEHRNLVSLVIRRIEDLDVLSPPHVYHLRNALVLDMDQTSIEKPNGTTT